MDIYDTIRGLLTEETSGPDTINTLIFALGDLPREYIERKLGEGSDGEPFSIDALERADNNVKVLFLNRLQYLYMYLMKLEVESLEQIKYDRLIIYGLDVLLAEDGETTDEQSSVNSKQVRLCNLVYHALYKINRKYELKEVKAVSYNSTTQLSKQLARIESYWKHVC